MMIISSLASFYLLCLSAMPLGDDASDLVRFAMEVRHFSFEASEDRDFDGQPDDWSRRRGPGFPEYVEASVDRTVGSDGSQSLRFDVNGGKAIYYSPLIPVDAEHSYILHTQMKTEGLVHDAALVSISLLDHKRQRIRRYLTRPVTGTHNDWVTLEVGPLVPDLSIRFVVIGCHLVQQKQMDIRGKVWFDNIWLGSLPRMSLATNSPTHFFRPGEPIEIQADLQGLDPARNYRLIMKLEGGAELLQSDVFELKEPSETKPNSHRRPVIRWNLPKQPQGSYMAWATLERDGQFFLQKQASFTVMDLLDTPASGDFGWSLPDPPVQVPADFLADAVYQSGVRLLKYPLWSMADPQHEEKASETSHLLERLDRLGIVSIGLLNHPPNELARKFAYNWVGVSKVFSLPGEVWYPTLEPVIARYSFHVRHWQLGGENDDSFVGMHSLPGTLKEVKREFDRIGRDVHLGLHWDWETSLPTEKQTPNTFYTLSADNGMTDEALIAALEKSRGGQVPRYVLLRPLPRSDNADDTRAGHLVRKMVAAKIGSADGIFLDDPLDEETGLLNQDGSPTALYLPWRSTTLALRGSRFLGRLTLPRRSENAIFIRPGEMTMLIWKDTSTKEQIYLGNQAQAFDVWGRPVPITTDTNSGLQSLPVGPVPVIVRNCSEPLVRWQMDAHFEVGQVSSEYGGHTDAILGKNSFSQGVSGTATLRLPKDWKVEPFQWPVQVAANEDFRLPVVLTFPPNSSLGTVPAQIEFDISADRPYKFTINREYRLGLGDLTLDAESKLLPNGVLEIVQRITRTVASTESLDFTCSLSVPGQKRQRQLVHKLGTVDYKTYYVPNGRDIIGRELWIRAEQTGGNRVLNYKWVVEE